MGDNSRVLDEQTVEAVVNNLRDMDPQRRTAMISELLPFLGCFLAELLRAINLAQLSHEEAEPEYIEDDAQALIQLGLDYPATGHSTDTDQVSMVQTFDPRIPFGSKLTQIQAQLNGLDSEQCAQAAWHLHVMTSRLRRLAGTMTAQVSDRFLRLEALVATYVMEEVEVPLSLQVWSEGQLRTLIPYLNGGRTPECELGGGEVKNARGTASTAASSTDAVEVVNSEVAVEPEYKVRRSDAGPWEAATEEEARMVRAHDEELSQEARAQEEADRAAFREFESSLAQRWDDWAVRSEMDRERPLPSRKRIKVTVCVGAAGGQEVGTACVEGTIDHGQQPIVTFQVEETLLGGTGGSSGSDRGPAYVSAQAAPQLAGFQRDHVPGLSDEVGDFMVSQEEGTSCGNSRWERSPLRKLTPDSARTLQRVSSYGWPCRMMWMRR